MLETPNERAFFHGSMRHLIINGDDLGMCEGVNSAIFDLHKARVVTSASLLVNGEAAREAVYFVQNHCSGLSIGLHLDFGNPPFKIDWLAQETKRQWQKFIYLVGEIPTHVDIHNYSGISPQVSRFLPERVPLRKTGSINYIDKFNGANGEECVSIGHLIKLLRRVKKGVYELACHPGYDPIDHRDLKGECGGCRELEFRTLLDSRVRTILDMRKIELISYLDLIRREQFRVHILDRFYTTL